LCGNDQERKKGKKRKREKERKKGIRRKRDGNYVVSLFNISPL